MGTQGCRGHKWHGGGERGEQAKGEKGPETAVGGNSWSKLVGAGSREQAAHLPHCLSPTTTCLTTYPLTVCLPHLSLLLHPPFPLLPPFTLFSSGGEKFKMILQ